MKRDTLFISFYEGIREETQNFNEIEKARFNDITYRRLYAVFEFLIDTNEMNPIRRQWAKQWEDTYGMYGAKADSVIGYWKQYKKRTLSTVLSKSSLLVSTRIFILTAMMSKM